MNGDSWAVVAQDPSVTDGHGKILTTRLHLPPERLDPGPCGARIQIIDYDATTRRYRPPLKDCGPRGKFADPSDEQILEHPGFRAHNVFAIAMHTLGLFEDSLGRRVPWAGLAHQLKVAPHAFIGANAFYSRHAEALMFGYFRGASGPVFSSLSHDVVVHETTHALIDGLRERFTGPSLPDQAAFHEGFADVVALLSVLSNVDLVRRILETNRGRLPEKVAPRDKPMVAQIPKRELKVDQFKTSVLFGLAQQMGEEMSGMRGHALRRSLEITPSKVDLDSADFEAPHRRGEVLASIFMHTFAEAWSTRLLKLAGNGTTVATEWVAEEAASIADGLLRLAITALDYTPPVHLEFGDYLSALITADHETRPDGGKYHLGTRLTEMFAKFGVVPCAGKALDGRWLPPTDPVDYEATRFESLQRDPDEAFRFIWANSHAIGLEDLAHTRVLSVRPVFRRAPQDGLPVQETVVECLQLLTLRGSELRKFTGLRKPAGLQDEDEVRLQGGVTLVFDERGLLKFAIRKPLHPGTSQKNRRQHQQRLDRLVEQGWYGGRRGSAEISQLHQARALGATTLPGSSYKKERWT